MTRRLIITGTRETLSAEDRKVVTGLVLRGAKWADEVGVGDCPTGVDALVRELVPGARVFHADWDRYGRRAGPLRNGDMVRWAAEASEPWVEHARPLRYGWLLGFPGPTSRGTWDCIKQARAAGVKNVVWPVGGAA